MQTISDPAQRVHHEQAMRAAITAAEHARGRTGDNPWVGCAITDGSGRLLATGHTRSPGGDHAELVALRRVQELAVPFSEVTLYSTLEPCSFHGRTPACSRAIIASKVRRVVIAIRDPDPRVDGSGVQELRTAGVEVLEGICAHEVTRQLAPWIFEHHPHEPLGHARALLRASCSHEHITRALCVHYGVDQSTVAQIVRQLAPH